MSVLYVALPAALLLGAAGCIACLFCIMRGQYDDLESPAVRMLIDEESTAVQPTNEPSVTVPSLNATSTPPLSAEPSGLDR